MRLSTKVTIGAAAIIVLVNVGVLHLVGYRYESDRRSELTESARSFYKLVVVMRSWVSSHDGVYVRKQPGVEPNPYLGNPMVVTVEGDTLVWRNPAMVTRELSELSAQMGKRVEFHVTSLDPMNPANVPTEFEREALSTVMAGDRERLSPFGEFARFEAANGERQYRYFAPLFTEESCLSCHGTSGYQVGDVRGGISVVLPADGRGTDGYMLTVAGAVLASLVASVLLFVFFQRAVIRPLLRLERAAAEIGQGRFDTEILTDSQDEIGDVGRAMAKMQEAIRISVGKQVETEKMFALGQLSAGIAHEIRNPLFAIRNDLDYLRRTHSDDGRATEVYNEMEEGVERISSTVNAVLGYARPHRLEYAPHGLPAVVERTRTLLATQLRSQGVALEVDLDGLPRIEVDAHQMEQVLVNLITNAIRAAPGGRVRVAGRVVDGGESVELRVTDDGHGIDPVDAPRIFDPFYTRSPDGTGLGLTIVRRIIEMHSGEITLESEPGQGTTFIIRLPVRQPAQADRVHA